MKDFVRFLLIGGGLLCCFYGVAQREWADVVIGALLVVLGY